VCLGAALSARMTHHQGNDDFAQARDAPDILPTVLKRERPLIAARHVPAALAWAFANEGDGLFAGQRVPAMVPRENGSTYQAQVASPEIFKLLEYDGSTPLWSDALLNAHSARLDRGASLSCSGYPHSAEDIAVAVRTFELLHRDVSRVAVFGSVSPWVESVLLRQGAPSVLTVDWAPPRIAPSWAPRLRSLGQGHLAEAHARGELSRMELLVSFSSIEHDGLGRYGDPLRHNGDLNAMREMWLCLGRRGVLLLGVPTQALDDVQWPWHRLYGPRRLSRLLRGFESLGRVWDGNVVRRRANGDGLRAAEAPVLFPPVESFAPIAQRRPGEQLLEAWQHQQVLVLRKNASYVW